MNWPAAWLATQRFIFIVIAVTLFIGIVFGVVEFFIVYPAIARYVLSITVGVILAVFVWANLYARAKQEVDLHNGVHK